MAKKENNGFWRGTTEARLHAIELSLEELKDETRKQSEQLGSINRKLSYVYGFAGGIGVIAGVLAAWFSKKLGL